MTRYRTIVADPPWAYDDGFALGPGHGTLVQKPLPYGSMSLDAIKGLPVERLAFPVDDFPVAHYQDLRHIGG